MLHTPFTTQQRLRSLSVSNACLQGFALSPDQVRLQLTFPHFPFTTQERLLQQRL